ncbi:MAG: MBL fold metallo-hydrolase, partial [Deltaproteobacteria bacterium]|nr:MBL fold metallo-hydrolase [Deltaproteobacteria bacterium]
EPDSDKAETVVLSTEAGDIVVTPVYHGTAIVSFGEVVIWVDPWSKGSLEGRPRADVVLITDIHSDHLDPAALALVSKDGTKVVTPKVVADALERKVEHVLANGEQVVLGEVTIQAIPMYNKVRGPEEGVVYHEKGRGNGYLLTMGGKRVYFAGDAFVPMNLPYTMPPSEAAECVKAFRPAVVVPYHYAGSDLAEFSAALEGVEGVTVRIVEFYEGGLPF